MRIKLPLFPKSLAGRVFALYAANLLLFVAAGLFLFYNYQFNDELESAQETATVLGEVVAQSASDSAVIGDYDAIKRTLQQAVRNPMLGSASYIDVAGGIMTVASSVQPEGNAPAWLARRVGDRLLDLNNVIKVGGREINFRAYCGAFGFRGQEQQQKCGTLSGGETFYTSLALALGLADVVVAQAGGAQLDTLFIDEGFGSLDPDTLDDVMGVIDDLRGNGRVIGIVSHVPELKDRIAERLTVRRVRPDGPSTVIVRA